MTLPVSPLQLGLIVAGVVLVVGVLIYNWWLERRVRRRIEATFRKPAEARRGAASRLAARRADAARRAERSPGRCRAGVPAPPDASEASTFTPPMDVIAHDDVPTDAAEASAGRRPSRASAMRRAAAAASPIPRSNAS